jgi:PadR family transcriptional regulator AphA
LTDCNKLDILGQTILVLFQPKNQSKGTNEQMEPLQLPTTSYLILGMLTYREMSGYDLKQLMDKSIKHFYESPAKSQIYAELRRLEAQEYITLRDVVQTQRPDKRLYSITTKGMAAMQHWLEDTTVKPDSFKSPLLLKLFFGHLLPPEALIAQLNDRRCGLLEDLVLCEEKEWDLRDRMQEPLAEEDLLFPLLALRFNMASIRAAIAWTNEALEQLKRRGTTKETP